LSGPIDIETFEPIGLPCQAIREWISDDDADTTGGLFALRPVFSTPLEIRRQDGSILVLNPKRNEIVMLRGPCGVALRDEDQPPSLLWPQSALQPFPVTRPKKQMPAMRLVKLTCEFSAWVFVF
jgi:hypothetical protein